MTPPLRRLVATLGGPWPMFVRVFSTLLVAIVVCGWAFGQLLGVYQDRAVAETLAPLWAAALQGPEPSASGAARERRPVAIGVELVGGAPPESAAEMTTDARMKAVVASLAGQSVDVQQVRLDDRADPPVTWLRIQGPGGVSRWVGIVGGVQPSDFRRRLGLGLLALVAVAIVVALFVSHWVAAPLKRLVAQLDGASRGERPPAVVRGAREIERVSDAIRAMAERRAADEAQLRALLLGVSHDLRSPLARIRVAAELLDTDASGKLRDVIAANVEQADAIIESFLAWLRADGRTGADAAAGDERIDLAQIARLAAEAADLPPGCVHASTPVYVHGQPTLLQRVAANLLDNAERHGRAPVEIGVRIDEAAREATLAVDDAGPGIGDTERLRKPFERGDASRSARGAGLGLAIVDRIVERHRGRVAFERSALGGTRVVVRLPLAPSTSR